VTDDHPSGAASTRAGSRKAHKGAGTAAADRRAELGRHAEQIATDYLQSRGLRILTRNYRRRNGELDIVARADDVLAVVEVRTRSSDAFGGAAASIDGWKRHKIIRATQQLLQQHRELADLRVRFDVIVVHDADRAHPRVEWIQHAFDA
jgi:putative endonuclease